VLNYLFLIITVVVLTGSAFMLAANIDIGAQVYPKNNIRRPKLLEQLQDMLAHKMCAAEMIVDANLVPGQRNPDAAVCLKLDVYREIFEAFIDGFAAYRPLLTQVKVDTQTV